MGLNGLLGRRGMNLQPKIDAQHITLRVLRQLRCVLERVSRGTYTEANPGRMRLHSMIAVRSTEAGVFKPWRRARQDFSHDVEHDTEVPHHFISAGHVQIRWLVHFDPEPMQLFGQCRRECISSQAAPDGAIRARTALSRMTRLTLDQPRLVEIDGNSPC